MSYRIAKSLWVPRPIDDVFEFFGNAANLELMTPPWLAFKILTPEPIEMRPGTTIDYRISLRGLPMRWRSQITTWNPPFEFVDEQLTGPYRRWHHRHTFESRDGGTLVGDEVNYDVLGGNLIHRVFVEGDLRKIFAFREETMLRLFGATSAT
ncbi:MAG: SRPBCC family protein [Acidobacteriota bacterium]